MLPMIHRVRTAADFARTVRSGARSGRRNVVLYGSRTSSSAPSRVGFIVGKNVGNAVTRNLVKRRLRHASAEWVEAHPAGYDVVVRALPPAAGSDWPTLQKDFTSCLAAVVRRLDRTEVPEKEGRVS
ncbi:ribonuclease P protein component [Arthrobacter agilis]|uniref:Ribonuclease P protein component n=2 Tax=Arthrobacter agilis TaxID=37921 RepID=A0A2L0UAE5_9MICC|nr:ribonuclease P protein component [Arthrobacter agilis]AUZ86221.1 ribonuclease P protein component [Arthrobacter agilis]